MNIFLILQIIVSVILTIAILLQHSNNGGIEGALGGGSSYEGAKSTRRGFDQFIFQLTIILSVALVVISILNIMQ